MGLVNILRQKTWLVWFLEGILLVILACDIVTLLVVRFHTIPRDITLDEHMDAKVLLKGNLPLHLIKKVQLALDKLHSGYLFGKEMSDDGVECVLEAIKNYLWLSLYISLGWISSWRWQKTSRCFISLVSFYAFARGDDSSEEAIGLLFHVHVLIPLQGLGWVPFSPLDWSRPYQYHYWNVKVLVWMIICLYTGKCYDAYRQNDSKILENIASEENSQDDNEINTTAVQNTTDYHNASVSINVPTISESGNVENNVVRVKYTSTVLAGVRKILPKMKIFGWRKNKTMDNSSMV